MIGLQKINNAWFAHMDGETGMVIDSDTVDACKLDSFDIAVSFIKVTRPSYASVKFYLVPDDPS